MDSPLSYDVVGSTQPGDATWTPQVRGFRRLERTVAIGHGEDAWRTASRDVLAWAVKTRSGFTVHPAERVREGVDHEVRARIGPFVVTEPVQVVAVVETDDRCGFAYGTREGHPVSGEEAFVVHRDADGAVWLTLRSLTRPSPGAWRSAFPLLLLAQRVYRWRYTRALRLPR